MLKVKNKKASKLCHWSRFGVFIVNFEHILHRFLVSLFLTLSIFICREAFSLTCTLVCASCDDKSIYKSIFSTCLQISCICSDRSFFLSMVLLLIDTSKTPFMRSTFFKFLCIRQRRIQNPVKHLRWMALQK